MEAVRTTCPYCGVGCGVLARPTEGRAVEIRGDQDHPANRGRLCSKGTHLGETTGLGGRLLHPEIHGRRAGWDEALDLIAGGFTRTIAEHGPDSVAFYVSGQLLTEDYYVANKLMKGFIGSANIDTNSRLCMSSAVAGHIRAFGEDVVPGNYGDLELADLIILVGSNTAWCHPIIWQRIEAARSERGTRLVVVDPRRTETADGADLHLAIRPGTDVALFTALLAHCRSRGLVDDVHVARHLQVPDGFWDQIAAAGDAARVAEICDVPLDQLEQLFAMFAAAPRTVTAFSQGVNQSSQGTDKVNAILNLHLATGRIGKPGAAPFSVTGQPNAMGGREVGGLASTLAAHMDFSPSNRDRVQRFWNSPAIAPAPGLKAVDMFDAIHDGRIKALWVMATNPAVSMPRAAHVREALARCPLVIVSDVMSDTDTGRFAHVKLPALAWAEKDGTVTNSERMVSRQRPFLEAPGETRADWWALAEVGRRMGWAEAFDYPSPATVFREHCLLTGFENGGSRKLDMSDWVDRDYDALEPERWGGERLFGDQLYPTPDGRGRLMAVTQQPLPDEPRFPLRLNSGRYRDQWHTMTRTGLSPRLSQHRREPLVEMHPADGKSLGLDDGGLARVETAAGASLFRVALTDRQRHGEAFVPIHWTDTGASGGRAGLLMNTLQDPLSGQPGFKLVPARAEPFQPAWHAFLITRRQIADPGCAWWVRSTVVGGYLYELAGEAPELQVVQALLPGGRRLDMIDGASGARRTAVLDESKRLSAALFISATGSALPSREWLIAQLSEAEPATAAALLAGRSASGAADAGPITCVCFGISSTRILGAIRGQDLSTVSQVGEALQAGTNCGSCRPAIAALLKQALVAAE